MLTFLSHVKDTSSISPPACQQKEATVYTHFPAETTDTPHLFTQTCRRDSQPVIKPSQPQGYTICTHYLVTQALISTLRVSTITGSHVKDTSSISPACQQKEATVYTHFPAETTDTPHLFTQTCRRDSQPVIKSSQPQGYTICTHFLVTQALISTLRAGLGARISSHTTRELHLILIRPSSPSGFVHQGNVCLPTT